MHVQTVPRTQVAAPEDACVPIERPLGAHQGFIALITRSEQQPDKCSFDVKARLRARSPCSSWPAHELE